MLRTIRLIVLSLLVGNSLAVAAPDRVLASMYQDLRWRMVGPFRGGRTKAVAGVPTQPSVFYIAPVNGGVWKTEDYGRIWRPIFDGQPTQSVGAIAVAPSNPNIIYVGTGEGLHRPDLSVGDGVYKSTDAGKTWKHLGLRDGQQIPQIVIDPKNPNRVFAAVLGHPFGPNEERGVYRSLDGGQTWQRVLHKDANTGAYDLEMDPQHPDVLYASLWEARLGPSEDNNAFTGTGGGLYKSTDGGTTWQKLSRGLPANAVQFDIAIAPSRPRRLYVLLSTSERSEYGTGKGAGMFRSDDAGATWTNVTTDERPLMRIGGGDLMVPVVDPKNPDVVYVASIVAMKSVDAGKTWTWLRGAPGGDDYQNVWINPNHPNTFLMTSDQGAVVTVNGGKTWSSWYNQPTAQLYHVGVSADTPYRICSGQQESGSVCISSRGNDGSIGYREWRPVGVIEYGYVAPDPKNADIVYGAGRNQVTRFQWSTGQIQDVTPIPIRGTYRVDRTQPILFSPLDPNRLYYAANVLFESTNGGQSWRVKSPDLTRRKPGVPPSVGALANKNPAAADQRGAIYALAPSFKSTATLWAGTDDGKLWVTRDGGRRWNDITPAALTPWSKVTQLEASHFDDVSAYASVSRFRVDDLTPYIYKTHDGGKSWTLITGGLPPGPVNAVREDPVRKGMLFASTETGVWVSFDDGGTWQSLQLNLPRSSARDVVVHGSDLIVATHGRGFWILDDITPLRHAQPTLADTLFKPARAIRTARSSYPDTPVPPDEPHAENPPTGAVIDYYLATPSVGPVTLEVSDARGKLLRRYTSTDPPEQTRDELVRQLTPSYWVRPHRVLATTTGHHRWVWDLRGQRPLVDSYGYPINAVPHDTPRVPEGPRVMPGTYTIRLTASGKTLTTTLDVKLDPRVKITAAALARQNQLEQRVAELVTQSSELVMLAQSALDQLGKLSAPQQALKIQIAATTLNMRTLLSGPERQPAQPPSHSTSLSRVSDTLTTLYGMLEVDAAPTAGQIAEAKRAETDLGALIKAWNALKTGELAQLNVNIAAVGLPPIRPEAKATQRHSRRAEE